MNVDLLLDPGGEVRHVAVHARSEHFTEAHAAPRRQAEQRPVTALLLTHERTATVAHAGVDGSSIVTGTKHPGSDGLHVKVRLTLRQ